MQVEWTASDGDLIAKGQQFGVVRGEHACPKPSKTVLQALEFGVAKPRMLCWRLAICTFSLAKEIAVVSM